MRLTLTVAALAFATAIVALPAAQAGPVERLYDSIEPGEACFAATTLVTGKPTCVGIDSEFLGAKRDA